MYCINIERHRHMPYMYKYLELSNFKQMKKNESQKVSKFG